jgi:5'(3')-deoxyribonucleotidase
MGTKTIGMDLDGVLADSVSRVLAEADSKFGVKAAKEDIVAYDMEKVLTSLTHADVIGMFRSVWDDPGSIPLEDPRIPEILGRLHDGFRICITTAAVGERRHISRWLSDNGLVYDELMQFPSLSHKHSAPGVGIYVDDCAWVVENVMNAGKVGILLRQPWNEAFIRESAGRGLMVADDWGHLDRMLYGYEARSRDRL